MDTKLIIEKTIGLCDLIIKFHPNDFKITRLALELKSLIPETIEYTFDEKETRFQREIALGEALTKNSQSLKSQIYLDTYQENIQRLILDSRGIPRSKWGK